MGKFKQVAKCAVMFSFAEKTNHGPLWPEPLLSNSMCLYALKLKVSKTGKSCITFRNFFNIQCKVAVIC
jgi:hypothetical protein